VDGGDDVPLTVEMINETRADQVLGAGAAARTAARGIVGNEQELDVHSYFEVPGLLVRRTATRPVTADRISTAPPRSTTMHNVAITIDDQFGESRVGMRNCVAPTKPPAKTSTTPRRPRRTRIPVLRFRSGILLSSTTSRIIQGKGSTNRGATTDASDANKSESAAFAVQ